MPQNNYNKKSIRHLILVLYFSFLVVLPASTQVDAQLSQYMFNQATFNPASIGENGMINVSGVQKIQWLGIPSAPVTTYFTINAPFKFGNNTHALGVNFLRDQAGAFLNQSASVQYAFKKKVGEGILSVGAGVGFIGMGIIVDSLNNDKLNSDYHIQGADKAVPASDVNGMGLNIDAGVFYSTEKYYGGVSYVHLNNPSFKVGDSLQLKMSGIAFLTGGLNISFDDSKFILKPSALIKSDFITWQIDISSRLEYDKRFWGGLSYRFQDAAVIFIGLNIANGLNIGYAYDLPTNALITATSGSHEIYLSYSFALDTSKNNNKYKSIRIL